jgi:hypothetical protein
MRKIVAAGLGIAAGLAMAWGVIAWMAGGFDVTFGGTRLRSTNYLRPVAISAVLALVAIVVNGWRTTAGDLSRLRARVTPANAAAALAIATTLLSLAASSWTASGPDSYAYVSQASMLRDGRLSEPLDLAGGAPWPAAAETFAPFGYRVSRDGASLVPVTAAGLPLTMAALQTVAGHCAAFLVTPIAGGALVFLTFAIGRRVASPGVGLTAAWLVATSPALLFMLMWPMSDVPAAAWTAAMVLLLLSRSPSAAFGAGLAVSAAVLTRGALAPVAAIAAVWLIAVAAKANNQNRPWLRVVLFGLGFMPGVVVTSWLNSQWYGSPLASGYGTTGELFSTNRVGTNVMNYLRSLVETSPAALAGLAALAWPSRRLWPSPLAPWPALLLAAVAVAVCGPYLIYHSYEPWWYLRFLLPAWPALFIGTAVVCDRLRSRGRGAAAAAAAVVLAAGIFGLYTARARGVFAIGDEERRYVTVARLIASATEPNAVVLTGLHAGTLRYYAGRETVRFDVLDPAWLDRAVAWLEERGRHPYILVEDWEHPPFNARFGPANALGHLALTPMLAWQSTRVRGWVFLYDPVRRDRPTQRPGPEVERTVDFCAAPADRLASK